MTAQRGTAACCPAPGQHWDVATAAINPETRRSVQAFAANYLRPGRAPEDHAAGGAIDALCRHGDVVTALADVDPQCSPDRVADLVQVLGDLVDRVEPTQVVTVDGEALALKLRRLIGALQERPVAH